MIALITPTGGRPWQTALCAEFMRRQTYAGPVLWAVVDDCLPRTTDCIAADFRTGWQVLKVYPDHVWQAGENTQGRNLLAAIEALRGACDYAALEAVFIIEDDDYYKPCYLDEMLRRWDAARMDVLGERCTLYYNVAVRGWLRNKNDPWSSLFQTCFHPRASPAFEALHYKQFIDLHFWKCIDPERRSLFLGNDLAIGIKGQAGRAGIGGGHARMMACYEPDPQLTKLTQLLGDDTSYYYECCDGYIRYKGPN